MSLLTLFKAATRPTILLAGFLWVLHGVAHAQDNPRVSLVTNKGAIEIELLPKFAPKHVANFLSLVEEEFYVGLVFHRVIPNFMIQAGGYDSDLNYKASKVGLGINAGHDLDQQNLPLFANLPGLAEVSIGHAIICEALNDGFSKTIAAYVNILNNTTRGN